jgi:hypothetical protein
MNQSINPNTVTILGEKIQTKSVFGPIQIFVLILSRLIFVFGYDFFLRIARTD